MGDGVKPLETLDGSYTLLSDRYLQTYHSVNGASTEAHHVFLDASGVAERLRSGLDTRVLEIGFGLGLNALLTADLATTHNARLDYHAFEHDLVKPDVISKLGYDALLRHTSLVDALFTAMNVANPERTKTGCNAPTNSQLDSQLYPQPDLQNNINASQHRTCSLNSCVQLTLHLQDATSAGMEASCGAAFHAIYLDAFSHDTNSECWTSEFIHRLAALMLGKGRLSTYSARGDVRRAMLAAGLDVKKLPGPPGKREMLVGQK